MGCLSPFLHPPRPCQQPPMGTGPFGDHQERPDCILPQGAGAVQGGERVSSMAEASSTLGHGESKLDQLPGARPPSSQKKPPGPEGARRGGA